jgi:hypothetical protein
MLTERDKPRQLHTGVRGARGSDRERPERAARAPFSAYSACMPPSPTIPRRCHGVRPVKVGPLVTLGAVVALGAGILLVNMAKERPSTPEPTAAASPTTISARPAPAPPSQTAPPPEAFPPKADYVGKIPTADGHITLELTVEGNQAVAYACDGNTVEAWLKGSAENGAVHLANKANTSQLDGDLHGSEVAGSLLLKQEPLQFTAAEVPPPAGLYVYLDAGVRNSWIVDANGDVTGVQRQPDGSTAPAPELSTDGTAVINGKTITAIRAQGSTDDF